MPRIAIAVTSPETAHAFLKGQIALLHKRGWDVAVITSPGPQADLLREEAACVVVEVSMARGPAPWRDLKAGIQMRSALRSLRPDLLLASTPKASLLSLLAGRRQGIPCRIYHVRGLRLEGLRGLAASIAGQAERSAVKSASAVICDSESLLEQMRQRGLLGRNQGLVLGRGSACGVDTKRFVARTIGSRANQDAAMTLDGVPTIVGFVGRIRADKGVPELLQAVHMLRLRGYDVRLVLVGRVEEPEVLTSCAFGDDVSNWVTTTGHVEKVDELLPTFDIFALPSHREGLPIALLEAMATGLPVITTDATGCVDCVTDGQDGVVVAIGDVSSLAAAIEDLARSPEKRALLGAGARARVVRDYEQSLVDARFVGFLDAQLQAATATSSQGGQSGG